MWNNFNLHLYHKISNKLHNILCILHGRCEVPNQARYLLDRFRCTLEKLEVCWRKNFRTLQGCRKVKSKHIHSTTHSFKINECGGKTRHYCSATEMRSDSLISTQQYSWKSRGVHPFYHMIRIGTNICFYYFYLDFIIIIIILIFMVDV